MDPVPRYDTTASSDSSDQKVTTANQCPSADSNVFIFANTLNMAVEKLGTALDERIGKSLDTLGTSFSSVVTKMADVLENTPAQTQVRPSFEGTCGEDATASHSCLQDGAGDKPSIEKSHELGAPRSDEDGVNFDFQKSGCQTATKNYFPARPSSGGHSFHSIQNWATIDLHQQPAHAGSPFKCSDISICAPHADEFDEAINNSTKNNDIAFENNPRESIVPCVDNLFTKYMEEYKPDSAFGPPT